MFIEIDKNLLNNLNLKLLMWVLYSVFSAVHNFAAFFSSSLIWNLIFWHRLITRIRIFCLSPVLSWHETEMRWDQPRTEASGSDLTWNQDQNEIRSLWDEMRQNKIFIKWNKIEISICSDQHVIKKCYQCCKLNE